MVVAEAVKRQSGTERAETDKSKTRAKAQKTDSHELRYPVLIYSVATLRQT